MRQKCFSAINEHGGDGSRRRLGYELLPLSLTISRLILAWVSVVILLFGARWGWADRGIFFWALCFFLASSVTDYLDGYLARRLGVCSLLGRLLDPATDKVVVILLFVALAALGVFDRLTLLAVMIIVTREVLVTGVRVALVEVGIAAPNPPATKMKTALTFLAIVVFLWDGFVGYELMVLGKIFLWASLFFSFHWGLLRLALPRAEAWRRLMRAS